MRVVVYLGYRQPVILGGEEVSRVTVDGRHVKRSTVRRHGHPGHLIVLRVTHVLGGDLRHRFTGVFRVVYGVNGLASKGEELPVRRTTHELVD